MRKVIDIGKLKAILETRYPYVYEVENSPELRRYKKFLYGVLELEGEEVETFSASSIINKLDLYMGGKDLVDYLNKSLYQKIGDALAENNVGIIHTENCGNWSSMNCDKTELRVEVVTNKELNP